MFASGHGEVPSSSKSEPTQGFRQHPHLNLFMPSMTNAAADKPAEIPQNDASKILKRDLNDTWDEMHKPLGIDLLGGVSHIYAFDVSSGVVSREMFGDIDSWHNVAEAERIFGYVCHLVDTPNDDKKISIDKICILALCIGQVITLKRLFRERRPELVHSNRGPGNDVISIRMVPEYPWVEFDIVVFSLTMAVPRDVLPSDRDDLHWLYGSDKLSIAIKRSKHATSFFGDFSGWYRAITSSSDSPYVKIMGDRNGTAAAVALKRFVNRADTLKIIVSESDLDKFLIKSVPWEVVKGQPIATIDSIVASTRASSAVAGGDRGDHGGYSDSRCGGPSRAVPGLGGPGRGSRVRGSCGRGGRGRGGFDRPSEPSGGFDGNKPGYSGVLPVGALPSSTIPAKRSHGPESLL